MAEKTRQVKGTNQAILSDARSKNGLEHKLSYYKDEALGRIRFSLIIKPAIISFIALIVSFFLDLSSVPLLGNVTVNIAQALFPTWQPAVEDIAPYSFWWLPVLVYILFVFISYLTYNKLIKEISRTPDSETIDRIISSYTSVIDGIATALPLIGAAILLISIKLGEEVFLGLSVPFEIKALIVLALGKLFEPVLDQLGVEFQNVVSHVRDIREKYYSENHEAKNISEVPQLSIEDMDRYKAALQQTSGLSENILKNFNAVHTVLSQMNEIQNINDEKIEKLNKLANSITEASKSLSDEKTLLGLKHLETIVVKK